MTFLKTNLSALMIISLFTLSAANAEDAAPAASEASDVAETAKPAVPVDNPPAAEANAPAVPAEKATGAEVKSKPPVPEVKPEAVEEKTAEAPKADRKKRYEVDDKEETHLLGDFRVGPFVTAVALPRPVSFGIEAKYADLIGVSGGYGFFPEQTISSVKLKITGYDARFKIYPFKGAFFLGFGFGSQKFTGSQTKTISGVAVTGTVAQDNSFVIPHVGWNWVWGSGIFMGIDLGVQLSMKRTTTVTTDTTNATILATAEYSALQKDIADKADLIGKTPLPLLTLIKIGYMF